MEQAQIEGTEIQPSCRNCCHGIKHPTKLNTVVCVALPPNLVTDVRRHGQVTNMYPEMPADNRGCGVLWNVTAELIHTVIARILAGGDTLQAAPPPVGQPEGGDGHDQGTRKTGGDGPGRRDVERNSDPDHRRAR